MTYKQIVQAETVWEGWVENDRTGTFRAEIWHRNLANPAKIRIKRAIRRPRPGA